MTFRIPLLIVLGLMVLSSCKEENVLPEPQIEAPLVALNYDGRNVDAPILPNGNTFEAGIRIPASFMKDYPGGMLTEVYYYLKAVPTSCTVKIYKGTTASGAPEALVYSAITSSDVIGNSWNRHILSTAVAAENKDLWIVIRFFGSSGAGTLGCDSGPAASDGDWLLDSDDNQWLKLSARSAININWNIRGVLEP
ncbi:MAG: hypothetical protein EAZ89_21365, partial [Bacteroidetes bacterium]|jgi:hypothetical protein